MKGPRQVRFLNEEIIDEQLPSDVDGDDFRGLGQVRRRRWMLVSVLTAGRPLRRQFDAVVEDTPHVRQNGVVVAGDFR